MNEHENVRALLPLAASGDISPEDLRRLQEHLTCCEECRGVSDDLAALAGALRGLPTPQPREELVARVLELAGARLAQERVPADGAGVLAPLVVAGWIAALATWPLVRAAVAWLFTGWHVPGGFATALAAYSFLGLLMACVSAVAVGRHARTARRTR
jgi:hypothetical protein